MRKALLILSLLAGCREHSGPIVVGSKDFTESILLGEVVAQRLETSGCTVERRLSLGGTFVADAALTSGQLDTYVEYSGTALTAILKKPPLTDPAAVDTAVREAYRTRNLIWGPELGFNNTFAMIMRKRDADAAGIDTISGLSRIQSSVRPGFGYEFVERPDGWRGLLTHYQLSIPTQPKTMDLGLTYRALAAGEVDLIAGNSTDGLIAPLGLVILTDDRAYFPPYEAVVVARNDLANKCSTARAALDSLKGAIDEATMQRMNHAVDAGKRSPREVAAEFLKTEKSKG